MGKNSRNRTIVLMGAGSVIEFGGPKTDELTQLLLKDKEVGEINSAVYYTLKDEGIYSEINFESIIHFIDSLISYLRSDQKSGFKDIYCAFSKINVEFLEILAKVDDLTLQECDDIEFRDKNYERVVKLLFFNYNYILIPKLSQYIENPNRLNTDIFKKWYNYHAESNLFRFYTTNYDRLVPNILLDIFDGYKYEEKSRYSVSGYQPDIKKIINERNIPSHYNLHGCLHWSIPLFSDPALWESHRNEIIPPSSYTKQFRNSEPNHANFMIPIITGYAKVRKAQIPPIRHFFYSFERDLMDADKIIIAGYSFSDDHINNIIDVALNENPKAKIDIIDYDKDGMNNNLLSRKLDEKLINVDSNSIIYHMNGFVDYLKNDR